MMALSIEHPNFIDIASEEGRPVPKRSVATEGYTTIEAPPTRPDLSTPTLAETIRFRGQPSPTLVPGDAPPAPTPPTIPATPETWGQRRAEAVKRLPDFAQVVEGNSVPFSHAMAAALVAVPHGPDLAYELAKKPVAQGWKSADWRTRCGLQPDRGRRLPREPAMANSVWKRTRPNTGLGSSPSAEVSACSLPTSECPVLWRAADEAGYALCLYLPEESGSRICAHLARCNNPHLEAERALALLASDPPEIGRPAPAHGPI